MYLEFWCLRYHCLCGKHAQHQGRKSSLCCTKATFGPSTPGTILVQTVKSCWQWWLNPIQGCAGFFWLHGAKGWLGLEPSGTCSTDGIAKKSGSEVTFDFKSPASPRKLTNVQYILEVQTHKFYLKIQWTDKYTQNQRINCEAWKQGTTWKLSGFRWSAGVSYSRVKLQHSAKQLSKFRDKISWPSYWWYGCGSKSWKLKEPSFQNSTELYPPVL